MVSAKVVLWALFGGCAAVAEEYPPSSAESDEESFLGGDVIVYGDAVAKPVPFVSCMRREPMWRLWRVFDAHTAVVEGDLSKLEVKSLSDDSSLIAFGGYAVWRLLIDEDAIRAPESEWLRCSPSWNPWRGNASTCELQFSVYGESCVHVEEASMKAWRGGQVASVRWVQRDSARFGRVFLLGCGYMLFLGAPWLSKATGLHYASGVGIGVVGSLALLLLFLLNRLQRRRWVTGIAGMAMALVGGWAATAKQATDRVLVLALTWPRVSIAYLTIAGTISLFVTHITIRNSSSLISDTVKFFCRLSAVALASYSTLSASASSAIVVACLVGGVLEGHIDLSSIELAWFAATRIREALTTAPKPRAAPTRFISQREYEAQRDRTTRAELDRLGNSPAFGSWLIENHSRIQLMQASNHPDQEPGDYFASIPRDDDDL